MPDANGLDSPKQTSPCPFSIWPKPRILNKEIQKKKKKPFKSTSVSSSHKKLQLDSNIQEYPLFKEASDHNYSCKLSIREIEIMGSLQTLVLFDFLAIFTILLSDHSIGYDSSISGYHGEERDALYALKAAFNDPFLTKNWTGLPCYLNQQLFYYGIQCHDGRITGIRLEGLGLIGKINHNVLFNLTELNFISFKHNSITGNIMDFYSNKKLTHVDLSDNMFEGPIWPSLLGLDHLETLLLQNNYLTAQIPAFRQLSLREFNVSNNNLSGEIPDTHVLRSFDESSYHNNPGLCGPPSSRKCQVNESQSKEPKKKNKFPFFRGPAWIAIFVVLDVIALAFVTFLFFLCYKRVKLTKKKKEEEKDSGNKKTEDANRRAVAKEEKGKLVFVGEGVNFELDDLLKASAEGLGKGNFGICYKAMLDDCPAVVVKRLRDLSPLSSQEFEKQMQALSNLKHPNLLPLIAYYYSKNEKLLVYEFAQNGNLFNRIHGGRGTNRIPLKWNTRLLIARGVARAMEYLHLNTNEQATIPHGNLKSVNVLLDENDNALICDYGLTPLISAPIATQRMTSYKSPEYQTRRKISWKTDIWSYGCLLLELLTGKICSSSAPRGVNGVDLCNWVHRAVREEWTAEIFDLDICVQRNASDGMLKLLQVAIRCCDKAAEKRPYMEEVLREIESIKIKEPEDDDSLERSLTEESVSGYSSGPSGRD